MQSARSRNKLRAMIRLVLLEPDIPQNAGALARLAFCLGVAIEVIEPCGFNFGDAGFRRAGMDYAERARIVRHESWAAFRRSVDARLVLLTTKADLPYTAFRFSGDDVLLLGRESSGVPPEVHAVAAARIRVPMRDDARSLNVALAAAMVLGEALRQTKGFAP
jgi:tRNA (cytidine/uridine-2'-O-)-methyltransferase